MVITQYYMYMYLNQYYIRRIAIASMFLVLSYFHVCVYT